MRAGMLLQGVVSLIGVSLKMNPSSEARIVIRDDGVAPQWRQFIGTPTRQKVEKP